MVKQSSRKPIEAPSVAKQRWYKFGLAALIIGAACLLFLAQSAYWVNHTVFDQQNFSSIASKGLLAESSREAIAAAVVDKSLENRPLIKRAVGERVQSLISGLLGSDLSSQAVNSLTTKAYAYATTPNRQDIKIDLTTLKTPINAVISLSQNNNGPVANLASSVQQIPDEIVLVDKDAFPNLSGVVKLMLWLGPLLWLSTIGLFSLYIYIGRRHYAKRVYLVGLAIIIVSVFGLFSTPFIPPPIAAAIPNLQLRPVVENLTTGFLAPFRDQMLSMLASTLAVLAVFNQRFKILSLAQSVINKAK